MTTAITPTTLKQSSDDRRATLDRTLQNYGAQRWRIETRSDFQATIAKGKAVSHLLHFFLGLFTLGIWWLVWPFIGGIKRRMVTVDEYGNVVEQKL